MPSAKHHNRHSKSSFVCVSHFDIFFSFTMASKTLLQLLICLLVSQAALTIDDYLDESQIDQALGDVENLHPGNVPEATWTGDSATTTTVTLPTGTDSVIQTFETKTSTPISEVLKTELTPSSTTSPAPVTLKQFIEERKNEVITDNATDAPLYPTLPEMTEPTRQPSLPDPEMQEKIPTGANITTNANGEQVLKLINGTLIQIKDLVGEKQFNKTVSKIQNFVANSNGTVSKIKDFLTENRKLILNKVGGGNSTGEGNSSSLPSSSLSLLFLIAFVTFFTNHRD